MVLFHGFIGYNKLMSKKEQKMDRVKLNHEVGSVYISADRRKNRADKLTWDGSDFDHNFMGELIGSVISVLGIFFLSFALVMVL